MPRLSSRPQQQHNRHHSHPQRHPKGSTGFRTSTSLHGCKDTGSPPSGRGSAWAVREEPDGSLLKTPEEKYFFFANVNSEVDDFIFGLPILQGRTAALAMKRACCHPYANALLHSNAHPSELKIFLKTVPMSLEENTVVLALVLNLLRAVIWDEPTRKVPSET